MGLKAEAQSWPARPLKALIPFAAGSVTDVIPRVVFEQLSTQLGQGIVVENHAGGGATTGASLVATAEPDGYTMLVNSSAHTIAPAFYPHLSYDPARDFAGVIPLGLIPSVLVVAPAKGFKTAGDLVAAGKAKPGALNFASAGVGTATHLGAIRFLSSAGVQAVNVPFKGGSESITEVMTGRVDFFIAPVGVALPYVKDGRLTALAVNTTKRSAALPDVPTTAEAGFANAESPFWIGIFLPAKTPRDIVEKLYRETLKALQEPRVRDRLASLGVEPMVMPPREFDAQIKSEIADNMALVKATGMKTQ
jgi:tripartite-type tricarboxylate transporter receptor subunit TctC